MANVSNPAPGDLDRTCFQTRDAARLLSSVVSSAFSVHAEALCAPRRGGKTTAFARQVAMYLTHTHLGLSYTATGALFGRDRTTAAHACRTVEEKRDDASVDALVDCMERAIGGIPDLNRVGGGAD